MIDAVKKNINTSSTVSKCECAIFDLDGVIVDTAKYHYLAWKKLAMELGFNFSPEENEKFKGVSRMQCIDMLLDIGGIEATCDRKIQLADKKNGWYIEYISKLNESELLPGAKELIERLKRKGVKTALGSASKWERNYDKRTSVERINGRLDELLDLKSIT